MSTGLSQEASLNELSDGKVTQSAKQTERQPHRPPRWSTRMAIGMMTLAFGGDAASCEGAVEECEGAANGSDFAFEEESSAACDASYRDSLGTECTATVAEYEACGNATLAAQYEPPRTWLCHGRIRRDEHGQREWPRTPGCVVLEKGSGSGSKDRA